MSEEDYINIYSDLSDALAYLDSVVNMIERNPTESTSSAFRASIAEAIGTLVCDVMLPIENMYPKLKDTSKFRG